MPLATGREVDGLYRLFLGRLPETQQIYDDHRGVAVRDAVADIVGSQEFAGLIEDFRRHRRLPQQKLGIEAYRTAIEVAVETGLAPADLRAAAAAAESEEPDWIASLGAVFGSNAISEMIVARHGDAGCDFIALFGPQIGLDCPAVIDGSAEMARGRDLWLSGWALSPVGIESVAISLDGEPLVDIALKVERPDIAAAFPGWRGAAKSGFAAMIPAAGLPAGRHQVDIAARDRFGRTVSSKFVAEVDAAERGEALSLRRKIDPARAALHDRILARLAWRPAFHLILLAGNDEGEIERLRATLATLRQQSYQNWRLFIVRHRHSIAIDALRARLVEGTDTVKTLRAGFATDGTAAQLRDAALAGLDAIAERVEVVGEPATTPLSRVIGGAPGPVLFGLLASGDELSCDALGALAVASGIARDADFFYSDELRPSLAGDCEPFLKPQWSPDLLLSTNYIGRLWCAEGRLIERTGATLDDLIRYGEYDIVLRASELAREVRHLPEILCRRGADRLDAERAERRALERAAFRRGIAGEVHPGCASGIYRLKRQPARAERVSIVIPTCGARGLIRKCIESLRGITADPEFEIVCVDNNRERDSHWRRWLLAVADTVVETDEPFNWSRFNNLGAKAAAGGLLLFLNDDIEIIEPDWLDAMLEHAERPEVAVVGAQLLYPDRTVQHAGMYLTPQIATTAEHAFRHLGGDDPGYFGLALTQRDVIAVTGACFLTRREVFDALGHFEERHQEINNDLDYCLKAHRQGLLTVFTPYARLIHHEGSSRGGREDYEVYDAGIFVTDWRQLFAAGDPFYHPHLARQGAGFAPDREAAFEWISAARRDGGQPAGPPLCGNAARLPPSLERRLSARRVVLLDPGPADRLRLWPPGHFAQLIDLLVEREGVDVGLIGAGAKRKIYWEIRRLTQHSDAVFDLCGKIAPEALPGLLTRCALFVGNDGEPYRLAAGLGVPTIGIHSGVADMPSAVPAGGAVIALSREMDCAPCRLATAAACPRGIACLTGLRPGEVYAACRKLLALGAGEARQRPAESRPASLAVD